MFFALVFLLPVAAFGLSLQGSAPSHVAVGEQFRLSYTIATHDVKDIRLGAVPSAFEVLVGPSTSTSSSFQMVNGKTSSNESTTFTYVLMANKNGTFTIPAAHAVCGGKTVTSNFVTINVSGKVSANSQSSQQRPTGVRPSGSKIRGSDLFITVSASKKCVYEQEPVILTYKVYTQVELTALDGKMPDLKGFHTQELTLPQQKSFSRETYNGKTYNAVVWSKYMMYPQMTGLLTIPSITFNGTILQQDTNIDPFEAFFNGGMGYSEVNKAIAAPEVKIQVLPLPDKPKNFSGGVGKFSLSTSLVADNPKSGEPVTIKVVISGSGNLKLIKQPSLNLPKDFDKYDPKVEDNTKLGESGLEGNMTYEFLFVPRHKGKFTIPPVEFTYFDTETKTYRTLKGESYTLEVAKGEDGAGYTEQEVLQMLNRDIRYIKLGNANLTKRNQHFFGSAAYWILLVTPFMLFVILLIIFRQKAIEAANVAKMRGKKANKVATKKLKTAYKLLQQGKTNEFYDEVLRALWGYAGDKLNMPVEALSKDNIADNFSNVGVEDALISQFSESLDDCEFARFAPGDKQGNMEKVYNTAADVISKIETTIKEQATKAKKQGVALKIMLLTIMSAGMLTANAVTKSDADSAYVHEEYDEAIQIYEKLLKQGDDADVYFNLGNAYYRNKDYTHAILNYERALLLNPGDADIRFNLDMVRAKTIDRIVPESEMFFVSWYKSVVNITSVDGWAKIAVSTFILMLLLIVLYLLNDKVLIRRLTLYLSELVLVFFILSNIFALAQKHQLENRNTAIITASSVSVKSTPAKNGTDLFVIHEGTKVQITDNSMTGWKEVVLADGKKGWLEASQIERI